VIDDARIPTFATLGAVLVVGVSGALVALGGRSADAQFLQDQRHPPKLRPADVERVVSSAPDPRSGKGRGRSATCSPRGSGPLGNPWSCVVRFASAKRVRLVVVVQQDGSYDGRYVGIRGAAATGCCIDLPGTQ
jgi:hypothetical protein